MAGSGNVAAQHRIGSTVCYGPTSPIVVNSVPPGLVKTDLAAEGNMTPEAGTGLSMQHALGGESVRPVRGAGWQDAVVTGSPGRLDCRRES